MRHNGRWIILTMERASRPHSASEDEITRFLRTRFPARNALVETGIGDDAAVLRGSSPGKTLVVTTDMLLEDIDFRRAWATPAQVGHKALAVNLSDLAAMGAVALYYVVALALPKPVDPAWIRGFFRGLTALGRRFDADLIGGDLSSSRSGIGISITAIGTPAGRRAILRSGGRAGDLLYVTGSLGCSAAGLALLRSGILRGRSGPERFALRAHRTPEPRCAVGEWLSRSGLVSCLMDLSDGLSSDLPRLCEASGTGGEVCASSLPRFSESASWGCDSLGLAFHGGEDFELLFAATPRKAAILERRYPSTLPPLSRIGVLTAKAGVRWRRAPGAASTPLPKRGYDHFRGGGGRTPQRGPSL
jgi:thiamine-monophosphate kinase